MQMPNKDLPPLNFPQFCKQESYSCDLTGEHGLLPSSVRLKFLCERLATPPLRFHRVLQLSS